MASLEAAHDKLPTKHGEASRGALATGKRPCGCRKLGSGFWPAGFRSRPIPGSRSSEARAAQHQVVSRFARGNTDLV